MGIHVGGRYRYRINDYVVDTYFVIESFDGNRFVGRAQCWTEAIWYFDSQGKQIGTRESPNCGATSVSLVLEDGYEETLDYCNGIISSRMLH